MNSDPLAIWDHNKHQFSAKMYGLSEEKDAMVFLNQCVKHFLDQGVQWDVLVYLRTMMLSVLQQRFAKIGPEAEEHKTPPPSPGISEPEIAVMFKISDWDRAQTRIQAYNEQLQRQRIKDRSGSTSGRRPQGLIEYRVLVPRAVD